MTSKPMGMLLQDPTLRDNKREYLHVDYPFSLDQDFLVGMGSSKFVVRDEDKKTGVPMFAGLNWDDPNEVLTFERFNQRPLERPIRDNFQFHQVNVFAVAEHTLRSFEDLLGRDVMWKHGGPLVIRPHAFEGPDAHYDPLSPSLNFGYFDSPFRPETVWTCLSHDIISHELGHAVVDSFRPLFRYSSEHDTHALHESIGDLFALFSALEHPTLVERLYKESGGNMHNLTLISSLAEEFGIGLQGTGTPYLRSALEGNPYDPYSPRESHARSTIWTAAVYEILARFVAEIGPAQDEIRKSTSPEFTKAVVTAARLVRAILTRALHYMPLTGVTMPVLARLVYDADRRLFPSEPRFRDIAKQVFTERKLWDENLVFDAPDIGQAFEDFEAANTSARAQMIVNHADALRIPLGPSPSILAPRLTTVTRQKDTAEDKRVIDPQAIIERYLYFAYELTETIVVPGPDGSEQPRGISSFHGGTLVMDENFNDFALVTDPPVVAEDMRKDNPALHTLTRAADRFHSVHSRAIQAIMSTGINVDSDVLYEDSAFSLKVQGGGPARLVGRSCNIAEHLRAISQPPARFSFASKLGLDYTGLR
jgi:hypothetical protein